MQRERANLIKKCTNTNNNDLFVVVDDDDELCVCQLAFLFARTKQPIKFACFAFFLSLFDKKIKRALN